jgi:hypothetical protein
MTIGMIVNTNMHDCGGFISDDTAAIPVRGWYWAIRAGRSRAAPIAETKSQKTAE